MRHILRNEEIAGVSLELSLLLHAGVGTGDALSLLAEEGERQALLSGMAQAVDAGASLAAAMRESGAFPTYVCGLVEVGERTGRTEEALAALSRYYEDRVHLGRRIRSALLYPAVMLALLLVVIAVLLVKVLPIFDDVYASLGGRLTGIAGGLLTLGRWLERAMPALWTVLAAAAVLALLLAAVGPLRRGLAAWWSRHRGDRGLGRRLNNARLAQAMAMGMASGLPVEEAVALAAGLMEGAAKTRCLSCQLRRPAGQRAAAGEPVPAAGAGPAQRRRGRLHGEDCPGSQRGERGRSGRPGGPGGAVVGAGVLGAGGIDSAVGDAAADAHHVGNRVRL